MRIDIDLNLKQGLFSRIMTMSLTSIIYEGEIVRAECLPEYEVDKHFINNLFVDMDKRNFTTKGTIYSFKCNETYHSFSLVYDKNNILWMNFDDKFMIPANPKMYKQNVSFWQRTGKDSEEAIDFVRKIFFFTTRTNENEHLIVSSEHIKDLNEFTKFERKVTLMEKLNNLIKK